MREAAAQVTLVIAPLVVVVLMRTTISTPAADS